MTVGAYISKCWQLFWRYPVVFFLGIFVANTVVSWTAGILYGPIMCGVMYATLKAVRGGVPEFGDLFRGFDRFGDSLLAGIIVALTLTVTVCLCLASVFLAPFFALTFAYIIDQGLPWDKALSASWQVARRNYGKFLGFTLLTGLFAFVGIFACCLGTLVTGPIAMMAAAVLYADVTGTLSGVEPAAPATAPA